MKRSLITNHIISIGSTKYTTGIVFAQKYSGFKGDAREPS